MRKRKIIRKGSVTPKSKRKIFFRGVKRPKKLRNVPDPDPFNGAEIQEYDEWDQTNDVEREREAREDAERLTD